MNTRHLQYTDTVVAIVSDGINDAPLAAATIGIAMGVAGTNTTIEAVDVALMTDDLSKHRTLGEKGARPA